MNVTGRFSSLCCGKPANHRGRRGLPVNTFSSSLSCHHIQQTLLQRLADSRLPDNFVAEDLQPEVIHAVHVVLRNVNTILKLRLLKFKCRKNTIRKTKQVYSAEIYEIPVIKQFELKALIYHVHQNISYHNHRCLMIVPSVVKGLEEIIIQGGQNIHSDLWQKVTIKARNFG